MAPSKAPSTSWDSEDSESTPPSSPPAAPVIARRSKFEDEEDNDDVLDDWENEEDSEVEREKAKKAAEAKAKVDAEAKAAHKSRTQRIEEKREASMRKKQQLLEEDSSDEEETQAERLTRMRAAEKEADLKNAEDLFGGAGGINPNRAAKPVTVLQDDANPEKAIDLSSLKLFQPNTAGQFAKLRDTLAPLVTANAKKAPYTLFMPEFCKALCKEMNSEQIKKVASALSTLSNEKMKEEKAAEKGGKKSKAAKTKTSLNANRNLAMSADTMAYDDGGLDDGDFM